MPIYNNQWLLTELIKLKNYNTRILVNNDFTVF